MTRATSAPDVQKISPAALDAAFGPEEGRATETEYLTADVHDRATIGELYRKLSIITEQAGAERRPVVNIHSQLARFQAELPDIKAAEEAKVTTERGPGYKYSYAGLDAVSRVVLRRLGALGVAWVTIPTMGERGMELRYKLVHAESNTREEGVWPLTGNTANPQALGSQITYARRYALLAVTGVFPGGEDDDGGIARAEAEDAVERRMEQRRREAAEKSQPRREAPRDGSGPARMPTQDRIDAAARERAAQGVEPTFHGERFPAAEPATARRREDTGPAREAIQDAVRAQSPDGRRTAPPLPAPEDKGLAEPNGAAEKAAQERLRQAVATARGEAQGEPVSPEAVARIYGETDPFVHLVAAGHFMATLGPRAELVVAAQRGVPEAAVGRTCRVIWLERLTHAIAEATRLDLLENVERAANAAGTGAEVSNMLAARRTELGG